MARFARSNHHAESEMTYLAKRRSKRPIRHHSERCYFDRIGFDFAMI